MKHILTLLLIAQGATVFAANGRTDLGTEKVPMASLPTGPEWKKETLAILRDLKNQVETHPDGLRLRYALAMAQINHALESVSAYSDPTQAVSLNVTRAIESVALAEAGNYPDFVVGSSRIRFRRFLGGPLAEFELRIPSNYQRSKQWPLFVQALISGGTSGNMIDLVWRSLSHENLQWKEYQALRQLMREKLNIDEDRIYVNGECGNGMAAMALGLNYPDHFAQCSASLGNSYRHLAGNALNLPFVFVKGAHNEDPLVGYYDFAVKCFEYFQCRHFVSSKELGTVEARGSGLPQTKRDNHPYQVLLLCETLQRNKAYWVQIDGRIDENILGSLDAMVDGQTIIVKTTNVDAYTLDLAQAPVDANQLTVIVENGKTMEAVTGPIFKKQADKYQAAKYVKNSRISGPIEDVFTDAFVVVYPTVGGDSDYLEQSKQLAEQLAHGALCIKDSDISAELIAGCNVVLVGNTATNKLMAQASEQLPIQFNKGQIRANGKCFDANDVGVLLIYPNPLNPDRYLAIFSARSSRALSQTKQAYSQMKDDFPADVGVFEVMENGEIKWHVREKFNTVWDWHDHYESILVSLENEYPRWRWRQWLAKAIKKQFNVDTVICEEHFKQDKSFLPGEVSRRDLFNTFRNDWIIKIRIKGKSLRKLMMVPFRDISKRETNSLVVEGVSLIKPPGDGANETLTISEIKDDQQYTVAIPYRCINGIGWGWY